jgi:hypothetical protein
MQFCHLSVMFGNVVCERGDHVENVVVELLRETVFTRRVQGPRRGQMLDHCLHINTYENFVLIKNLEKEVAQGLRIQIWAFNKPKGGLFGYSFR